LSKPVIRLAAPALLALALTCGGSLAANAAPTLPAQGDLKVAVPAAASHAGLSDKLSTWSVTDGTVHVGLTQVKGNEAAALKAQLGKNVIVTQEPRYEAAASKTPVHGKADTKKTFLDRVKGTKTTSPTVPGPYAPYIDAPAYKGGDRIISQQTINGQNYIVQCTVTAPFITGGTTDMLTAGHCGPANTHWLQGYWDGSKVQSSGVMGDAATVSWTNNAPDGTLLTGGSYTPKITTGATTTAAVLGAETVKVGTNVCTDGSFTGYTCGATVTSTDVCANISDNGAIITVCGLDVADASKQIVQSGDSGGPVVTPVSGGVQLAGTISAQANSGTRVLFTDVNKLQTTFNGTIAK
jgi:hypothetical protein